MFTDLLSQYGLFLAKTLTIIFGALLMLSGLIAVASKGKLQQKEGSLLVTHLNKKFEGLSRDLQHQTLSKSFFKKWLKSEKHKKKEKENLERATQRLFVLRFEGDVRASQVKALRESISALLHIASSNDEVLLVLESSGGFVHSYGLAASQLQRLRDHGIRLTVAIDKCAASGGYLMAVVAHKILAAPFAIIGSIGVVAQLPNFHRLLNKHHIDYELHTAGEYKRTLTILGENTKKAREKFQAEIDAVHLLFKDYITEHRPEVNVEQVATGEHWHAIDALKYRLVDALKTSDDFILEQLKEKEIFEITHKEKKKFSQRLAHNLHNRIDTLLMKCLNAHTLLPRLK